MNGSHISGYSSYLVVLSLYRTFRTTSGEGVLFVAELKVSNFRGYKKRNGVGVFSCLSVLNFVHSAVMKISKVNKKGIILKIQIDSCF